MKLIIFVLLVLAVSCNDEDGNGGDTCLDPIDIADTSCPAADLLLLCDSFFCGAEFPADEVPVVDFFLPPFERTICEVIDCNTLDCGDAGLFSDLEVDEFGTPSGTITNTIRTSNNL
jgi:hypothetical protein